MRRFLFVQLADIGDLILTTPAIAALRQAHPDAHIALLTAPHTAAVLPEGLVDALITAPKGLFSPKLLLRPPSWGALYRLARGLRGGRYDAIIYCHHFTLRLGLLKFRFIAMASGAAHHVGLDNGRARFLTRAVPDGGFGARHQAQYWLDLVALLGADPTPRPAQVAIAPQNPLPPDDTRPTIIIHPGSGGYSHARRWPSAYFAQVADALYHQLGARVVLVGTTADDADKVRAHAQHPPLDFSGRTTLPQLARLLASANLFIGADSGVMHLAAAVGVPVLAIFGPSNPDAWGPWTPRGRSMVLRAAPECSPCSYVGHEIGLRDGCPARTCMKLVTPEQVVSAAQRLLAGEAPPPPAPPAATRGARLSILNTPVDAITYEAWLARIAQWIAQDGPCRHVCTTNPEFIMIAQRDSHFRYILQRADLCIPDGVGLLWAARRMGHPLPERVTGSDGVPKIAERAAERGWRLFLLGAGPGVAERAATILQARHPSLNIVGVYAGSPAAEEEDDIVARVNASGADILFVAYGAPQQDKWIARNLPRLRAKMAMGVGGALDFIAGEVPRAPLWMQKAGLEWLFRLIKQPWRWRRMTRLPRFVWAIWRHS